MKPLDQYLIDRHHTDVWEYVFNALDIEPDTDTETNGQIAAVVESAFIAAMRKEYGD